MYKYINPHGIHQLHCACAVSGVVLKIRRANYGAQQSPERGENIEILAGGAGIDEVSGSPNAIVRFRTGGRVKYVSKGWWRRRR